MNSRLVAIAGKLGLEVSKDFIEWSEMTVGKAYYPPEAEAGIFTTWRENFQILCKSAKADMKKEVSSRLEGKYKARAENIARTELGKLNSAARLSQYEEIGITYYRWLTTIDGRERSTHRAMNGVICSVSNPEVYYEETPDGLVEHKRTAEMFKGNPGVDFQCRCSMVAWDPEIDGLYEVKEEEPPEPEREEEAKEEPAPRLEDVKARLNDLRVSRDQADTELKRLKTLQKLSKEQARLGGVEAIRKESREASEAYTKLLEERKSMRFRSPLSDSDPVMKRYRAALKNFQKMGQELPPSAELAPKIKKQKLEVDRLNGELEAAARLYTGLREKERASRPGYRSAKASYEAKAKRPVRSAEDALDDLADVLRPMKSYDDDAYRQAREKINGMTGCDGLPEVVDGTEFGILAKEGGAVLYRGLKNAADGSKSAGQMANELKYGSLWAGRSGGVRFGSGIYFTTDEAETRRYGTDIVVKAAVRQGAKVVSFEDAEREWNKAKAELESRLPEKSKQEITTITNELLDPGLFAALRGYDVILKKSPYGAGDYWVILDRRCLIIEE